MQLICFCLIVLAANVSALIHRFNSQDMPINKVETSFGKDHLERIDYLRAEIHPRHVTTNQRVNFPTSGALGQKFENIKEPGDERGHLVGSQFSGPPEWYNLSPQNSRVNRNLGYQSITTDWYGTECEVRKFLDQGGSRHVVWEVYMTYQGDSNRSHEYHLKVDFIKNGKIEKSIDTRIRNPTKSQNSTFWICRTCRSSGHHSCSRD